MIRRNCRYGIRYIKTGGKVTWLVICALGQIDTNLHLLFLCPQGEVFSAILVRE